MKIYETKRKQTTQNKNEVKTMKNETLSMAYAIINKDLSIRQVASNYGIAKSTVHSRLHSKRFQQKYPLTYTLLRERLKQHFETKHIKGGQATAALYKNKKRGKNNER